MSKQHKPSRNKNTGNALVFALLIVAVTSIIAYALIETSSFAVRRTQQLNTTDACIEAVHAAESYAMRLLDQQKDAGKASAITSLDQDWALPFEMQLGKDIKLKSQISDLQQKFNVNLLEQETKASPLAPNLIFRRLLIMLGVADAQTLEEALAHWIRPETSAQDQIYLENTPPYRVAHMPLSSISELKLILGFAPFADRLQPYVSALAQSEKVNVNTAPALLLAAILDSQEDMVQSLINERENYAFANVNEFANRARTRGINVIDESRLLEVIAVNSRYFLMETKLVCKQTNMSRYSFFERSSTGTVRLYQRTANL